MQYFYKVAEVVVLPFNKVENSGSVTLAMGFKKVIVAPKMGVSPKKLINQSDFLYKEGDLFQKLNLAYENKKSLGEIGKLNFDQLGKNNWKDFSTFFK